MFDGQIQTITERPEAKHSQAENTRAKEILGWEPLISLEDGINELKQLFEIA